MALKLFSRKRSRNGRHNGRADGPSPYSHDIAFVPAPCESPSSDPLKRLFQRGRYKVILHEESKWRAHPGGVVVVDRALSELEKRMALVPAGSVTIAHT